jgi:hypothetical protein
LYTLSAAAGRENLRIRSGQGRLNTGLGSQCPTIRKDALKEKCTKTDTKPTEKKFQQKRFSSGVVFSASFCFHRPIASIFRANSLLQQSDY